MDSNPAFSLSLLYRNDPIYSLCASDLMTASQTVNNNFVKEQKQLVKTLKKLENQQIIRMRQLNEEKKQFATLMARRLSRRGGGLQMASNSSGFAAEHPVRAFSAPAYLPPAPTSRGSSAKTSKSTQYKYSYSPPRPVSLPGDRPGTHNTDDLKVYVTSTTVRCVCKCGRSRDLLTGNESCRPVMQQRVAMEEKRREYSRTSDGAWEP
ncbi:hypothetical protein MATL_G00079930 [Megalops atlanticus]|uniref:Uncharacterized protein n=1 Tax=Megalops atlanticus TaxID=7932 RepID=A0A9D3TFE4_MEGAT|nr:hypothetical protein MATL_G00079930 [Megalops atlanticus]